MNKIESVENRPHKAVQRSPLRQHSIRHHPFLYLKLLCATTHNPIAGLFYQWRALPTLCFLLVAAFSVLIIPPTLRLCSQGEPLAPPIITIPISLLLELPLMIQMTAMKKNVLLIKRLLFIRNSILHKLYIYTYMHELMTILVLWIGTFVGRFGDIGGKSERGMAGRRKDQSRRDVPTSQ